jgi:hypothetical protein
MDPIRKAEDNLPFWQGRKKQDISGGDVRRKKRRGRK